MPTPETPKVPGSTDKVDAAADKAHEATDTVADEAKGLRAQYRAVRNDEDVQHIAKEAKPFLTGAAFVAGMVIDPPATLAVVTLRAGRAIQRRRQRQQENQDA